MKKTAPMLLAGIMVFQSFSGGLQPAVADELVSENLPTAEDAKQNDSLPKSSQPMNVEETTGNNVLTPFEANGGQPKSIKPADIKTRTYHFFVDGVEVDSSQILTSEAGVLVEPEIPEKENQVFLGWFIDGQKLIFTDGYAGVDPMTLNENKEIRVEARFQDAYHVKFRLMRNGKDVIVAEKSGQANGAVATSGIPLPLLKNESLVGWYTTPDFQGQPVGDKVTLNKSEQVLYGKIAEGHFLSFNVGPFSFTHIPDQFITPQDITRDPYQLPERFGYRFSHWTAETGTNQDGEYNGVRFTFGEPLAENTTLHAVWEKEDRIKYGISIYTQSLTDMIDMPIEKRSYSPYKSFIGEIDRNETKDNIAEAIINKYLQNPLVADELKGFHLPIDVKDANSTQYHPDVIEFIPSDGVRPGMLHVFYSRDKVKIHFLDEMDRKEQTFTGLYGQKLSQQGYEWPLKDNYMENVSDGRRITFLDLFNLEALNGVKTTPTFWNDNLNRLEDETQEIFLKKSPLNGAERIISHYIESLDGQSKSLKLSTQTLNSNFNISDKFRGFFADTYSIDGGQPQPVRRLGDRNGFSSIDPADQAKNYNEIIEINHKRRSYDLVFHNAGQLITYKVKFEEPLSERFFEPKQSNNLKGEYLFKGWYKDSSFFEPMVFENATMPADNVELYAKWERKQLTVKAFESMGTTEPIYQENTFDYGAIIDATVLPTVRQGDKIVSKGSDKVIDIPQEAIWVGWYVQDPATGRFKVATFKEPMVEDMNFYPYYYTQGEVVVYYYRNKEDAQKRENAAFISEPHLKDGDSKTKITSVSAALQNDVKKNFLGWTDDGKRVIYPSQLLSVHEDLHLYPVWGRDAMKTAITFHPGEHAIGDHYTMVLNNNGAITLPGEANITSFNVATIDSGKAHTFSGQDGYKLKGWRDDKGHIYAPGTKLLVDKEDEDTANHLTAVWVKTVPWMGLIEAKPIPKPSPEPIKPNDPKPTTPMTSISNKSVPERSMPSVPTKPTVESKFVNTPKDIQPLEVPKVESMVSSTTDHTVKKADETNTNTKASVQKSTSNKKPVPKTGEDMPSGIVAVLLALLGSRLYRKKTNVK